MASHHYSIRPGDVIVVTTGEHFRVTRLTAGSTGEAALFGVRVGPDGRDTGSGERFMYVRCVRGIVSRPPGID